MTLEEDTELVRYIKEYTALNLITPSNSHISSPLLFVKKPDGSLRMCVNYRQVNAMLLKDVYLIPRIDTLIYMLSQKKWFSRVDLRDAYYQLRMSSESEYLTTFACKYGCFSYRVIVIKLVF
jgi:hypothetical protein